MQHDEMIWQVINNQFCSYKTTIGSAKSDKRDFCRHPYSVTGLCNRSSCPLANSRYATIREEGGRVSLYLKTVERAHSPKNLWEKITLSRNYGRALAQLDEHLAYWPKNLVHRNKQRLTKIHQYLIRMRKIKLKELAGKKARVVGTNRKIDQREGRREKKALVAAKIESSIEKELVERLARGTYGDIYNFPEVPYQKALEGAERAQEQEEGEMEEESESDSEEEMEEEGVVEYVEDFEEDEDEEDMEDMEYMGEGQWRNNASDEESVASDEDEEEGSDEGEESAEDESDEGSGDEDEGSDEEVGGKAPKKPKGAKKPDRTKRRKPEPKKRRGTRVEIEYEEENEEVQQMEQKGIAGMAW